MTRLLFLLALIGAMALPASAQVDVRITEGTPDPTPIAIPTFDAEITGDEPTLPNNLTAEDYAELVTDVVIADLESSGLFRSIDEAAFTQNDLGINVQPRWADWRVIGSDFVVVGQTRIREDGLLNVAVRLWDVYGEEQMRLDGEAGRQYVTSPDNWRRIAHKISDDIYTRLIGDEGYFDSRIVYIAESGPKTDRTKRLAIMDQDGANRELLTPGINQVLTPRFSPSAQVITYMSFDNDRPRVYLFDIETSRQEVLGNFPGLTYAPRFTPDGRSVIMSQVVDGGNSEVFLMNLQTRQIRQLTNDPAIDTSPSVAPSGDRFVFTSSRGGSQQLYIKSLNDQLITCPSGARERVCRLTFGRGNYSTPVWSPRGDLIAFTKQLGGKFYIGVIRTDGEGERLLTESYLDEGPTWSPNGRVIAFFREPSPGAEPRLFSIDLTGRNLRQLPTDGAASDPAWSPLLD